MYPGQQLKMVMGNHPFFYFPLHIDTAKNKEAANHQYAIYNLSIDFLILKHEISSMAERFANLLQ